MPDDTKALPTHDEIREHLHRQMLSSVSHDLKTPLSTIIGSLEVMTLLYDRLPEEKRKALVSSALIEAFRLDYFITNILDMAKFEADAVKPRFEPTRLSQMVKDSLARLGPLKTRGDLVVHDTTLPDDIVTDSVLGARAIGLVLHNAFKHGGRKGSGDAPSIEVDCLMQEGLGLIRIRDRGDGIPADQHAAVFDKYTRLRKTDQQTAGTGLGLTICQNIMRLLGGAIEIADAPGGGALFTLTFANQTPTP